MRELIQRVSAVVDPNWFRIWLACYGGSLSILAAYLISAMANVSFDRMGEH